jgi:hypothetical protein
MGMRHDRVVAAASERDWFRSPTWDERIEAGFERRLSRARPRSRSQYIRLQATHLLDSSDSRIREAGRSLLRRVVAEYPDDFQAKTAMEQLGASLAEDGQTAEAELALRETLRMCSESPIGKSGTSGTPELRLAELILASGDMDRLDEVADLLNVVEPAIKRQKLFRNVVLRYLVACARLAQLRRSPAAAQLARDALAVAAETTPPFPRRPDVGRPSASAELIQELSRIADEP